MNFILFIFSINNLPIYYDKLSKDKKGGGGIRRPPLQ